MLQNYVRIFNTRSVNLVSVHLIELQSEQKLNDLSLKLPHMPALTDPQFVFCFRYLNAKDVGIQEVFKIIVCKCVQLTLLLTCDREQSFYFVRSLPQIRVNGN